MHDTFRQKLKRGDRLVGTLVTLPSAEVAEILAGAGFDWLFIDAEHAPHSLQDVQRILQAAEPTCPCVVRSPGTDEVWIKRILDLGPAGVIFPQVNTADDARRIVRLCKYPPEGTRSVGIGRAHGYGMNFENYVRTANEVAAIILQVEHINAVNQIDAIVAVPGIDAIFVGPYDLSGSMGKVGQVDDPNVQHQIEIVRTTCLNAHMPLGIFGVNVENLRVFANQGYALIAAATDALMLGRAAKETVEGMRT